MNKTYRILVVAALIVGSFSIVGTASGGRPMDSATNDQEGDTSSETEQSGSSSSGDAVGGQVVGVVSSGDASVDSTNRSEDVDIETGDAQATNNVDSFTGQQASVGIEPDIGSNEQEGDNSTEVNQTATATSGDGVGGSVIGVVTSAGGSADVVAANTSEDVDIETGDAEANNELFEAFTGQSYINLCGILCQIGSNEQTGDNELAADQSSTAASGDGVGGQVLGIVSAGDASVDATNSSTDVDIETGDADADNEASPFTGQDYFRLGLGGVDGENELDGNNSTDLNQTAAATSGDGVGGQVAGVVTSAGGSADVVAANTSEDVDVETGDASADNFSDTFVGQEYVNLGGGIIIGYNYQTGDNDLEADQSATAASGDGVGGQVLGIVSAGDASVDATNSSTDVDIETGDADADNFASPWIGQLYFNGGLGLGGENDMDGDITYELGQDANAASGDAVAGQVAGVVTSAGGSADLVLANTSEDIDAESGEAEFDNDDESFIGQQIFVGGLLLLDL